MATTGTHAFDLNALSVIEEGFERCGRDPAELTHRHIRSAIRSLNLLQIEVENDHDLPFRIDRVEQALTQGSWGFWLPVGTIDVLSAYLVRTVNSVDTVIPMRRMSVDQWEQLPRANNSTPVQYAVSKSLPGEASLLDSGETAGAAGAWGDDTTQGSESYPTHRFAFLVWPPSDSGTGSDSIVYHRLRSAQDVAALSDDLDAQRAWLDAVCAGLAKRLAVKWAPDRVGLLEGEWMKAVKLALNGGKSRDVIMISGRGIGHSLRRRRY